MLRPTLSSLGALLLSALFTFGCGANVSPASNAPNIPTSAPPSGSGGSGASRSSTSGTYQAAAMWGGPGSGLQTDTAKGTITVSTSGDVTVQVSGIAHSSTYNFQFCEYPRTRYANCMDLASALVTDSDGNGQLTFHFPKAGSWAGYFQAYNGAPNASSTSYITTFDSNFATQAFTLHTQFGVNPDSVCAPGGCTSTKQDPLGSGSVTVANATAHVAVSGAAANAAYNIVGCGSGGSDCYALGTLTTDQHGNGAADVKVSTSPAAVYTVGRDGALGYVTAFNVPQ